MFTLMKLGAMIQFDGCIFIQVEKHQLWMSRKEVRIQQRLGSGGYNPQYTHV